LKVSKKGHGRDIGNVRHERSPADIFDAALNDRIKNPNDKEALDMVSDALGQRESNPYDRRDTLPS
jgi:hypothetical protein